MTRLNTAATALSTMPRAPTSISALVCPSWFCGNAVANRPQNERILFSRRRVSEFRVCVHTSLERESYFRRCDGSPISANASVSR